MAKILENLNGRRSIRLSAEDVLAVVNQYQQGFQKESPKTHVELVKWLQKQPYYLPEEV